MRRPKQQELRHLLQQRKASSLPFVMLASAVIVAATTGGLSAAEESTANGGATYSLQYGFQPNQFVYYDVDHQMTIHMQKDEAEETVRNRSISRKHFRVVSVDPDGAAVLEPCIDNVKMTARFNENDPIEFDSNDPRKRPPQFEHILSSIGRPTVRLRVSKIGELLDVIDLSPNADANKKAGATAELEQNPDMNFLTVLPEKPLRIGESWSQTIDVPVSVTRELKQNVKVLRSYRLTGVEGTVAKIEFKAVVLTPVNDPAIRAQLIQRSPQGTIEFDMRRGLIVAKNLTVDKREIGIHGPSSLLEASTTHREVLAPTPAMAAGPQPR